MFEKTHQSYGVNEVLLASVLGAVVFSIAGAQPLVIVGVTGKALLRSFVFLGIGRGLISLQDRLLFSITRYTTSSPLGARII